MGFEEIVIRCSFCFVCLGGRLELGGYSERASAACTVEGKEVIRCCCRCCCCCVTIITLGSRGVAWVDGGMASLLWVNYLISRVCEKIVCSCFAVFCG